MACRLVGTMPLSTPMLEYCYSNLRNKFQWILKPNSYIFIHENVFENVSCEMAGIFLRPQCVKATRSIALCITHWFTARVGPYCRYILILSYSTFVYVECYLVHYSLELRHIRTAYRVSALTYWGRNKMAAISQTTLSNAFSWAIVLEFRLKFHWNLFFRV